MDKDINIGDIWKWIPSESSANKPEHWLISDYDGDTWFGICMDDHDREPGQQEITVGEDWTTWIKVG